MKPDRRIIKRLEWDVREAIIELKSRHSNYEVRNAVPWIQSKIWRKYHWTEFSEEMTALPLIYLVRLVCEQKFIPELIALETVEV